jgi:hypothetical protein
MTSRMSNSPSLVIVAERTTGDGSARGSSGIQVDITAALIRSAM